MDEQPKSIRRKSWTGYRWLRVWLVMSAATFLILVTIGEVTGNVHGWNQRQSALFETLLTSLAISTVVVGLSISIRWLCCWRNIKRSLFGLACLATLIALFYAEENWRGQRAWDNFRREWEAKGEKFDFKDFIPPPVPDDQNFAMTPVVAKSYNFILSRDGKKVPYEKRDTNLVNRLSFDLGDQDLKTNGLGYWVKGTASDLNLWQKHYRELALKTNLFAVPPQPQLPAADVLLALSKYDVTVEELRQASLLPQSRFPLNYDSANPAEILLPHLAALKSSSRLLQIRALAELENNQNVTAAADLQLMLRLSDCLQGEPTLISLLVRIAMTEIAIQPIYEGLAKHQWSDAQLVALDVELTKLNYLADFNFEMRCERAFGLKIIDFVSVYSGKRRIIRLHEMFNNGFAEMEDGTFPAKWKKFLLERAICLMPQGWFELNKITIAQLHEQWLLRIAEPARHQVIPSVMNAYQLEKTSASPFNFFAKELIPGLPNSAKKSARGQLSVDLARTAIALERYRLAHGEFPESLDALAPQFIAQVPHDVIGGGPLKYRREADGAFTLYSIGWNEKDDGGVTGYRNKSSSLPDFESGDWVWRYP